MAKGMEFTPNIFHFKACLTPASANPTNPFLSDAPLQSFERFTSVCPGFCSGSSRFCSGFCILSPANRVLPWSDLNVCPSILYFASSPKFITKT